MDFCEEYKAFLDSSKIEREAVVNIVGLAQKAGFKDVKQAIKNHIQLKCGDKVYAIGMDKTVALFVVGKEPMEKGMNIIGSHVDSPRLDLKPNPLYEKQELSLLKTHYYGGIKKYQWAAIPLAVHGTVIKGNGDKLNIVIGEDVCRQGRGRKRRSYRSALQIL
jgi:aspartyl aminopeptidase